LEDELGELDDRYREIIADLPRACDCGTKKDSKGKKQT
jgi:hypothetical protein